MRRITDTIIRWYTHFVIDYPIIVILGVLAIIILLGYMSKDFKIDASAETLLLDNDPDLKYSREINKRYDVKDYLFISFSPREGDLLSDGNLEILRRLRDELSDLEQVDSVLTILDVPLLESPPISYSDFSGSLPTLQSPETDKDLARKELRDSPFYSELIVSADMSATALIINLKINEEYQALIQKRDDYLEKRAQDGLEHHEKIELKLLNVDIRRILDEMSKIRHKNIEEVRSIIEKYRPKAEIFLGGVSMIADDMISYIRKDLAVFGLGVLLLLIAMLGVIFRRFRWIALPMLCCFFSVIAMMGILAAFDWEVTVISSNFISLQLIITLAISVHLIVRYREFQRTEPEADRKTLIKLSIQSKFIPCLYAALTTIAGFSSLILCDIKPVINFGWMMSAGILVSLMLTFLLFPSGMSLMKKPVPPKENKILRFSFTGILARFTQTNGILILVVTALMTVFSVIGISRLTVENSFIDYFKRSTEIYQGMEFLDQKLGGTTPFDVIVQFASFESDNNEEENAFDEDPFDEMGGEEDEDKYWFTENRMEVIERVHDYLEGLPETGKVLSIGTLLKIGRNLKGESLDSLEIAVMYSKLPEDYKDLIIKPYLSIDNNEARFSVRVKDSSKSLKRNAFLKQVRNDLINKLGLENDKVFLTGTMVLYNNMLQSLFSSQIKTLGVVAIVLLGMFLILFRSLKVALIAFFPNLLSSAFVLGVMGWTNIPLDMMTITIAAISIGIAVDDTIHYIYRFKKEIIKDGDYYRTLHRCHGSIGHAMYYTSIIIIVGFSILVFSNFWPTIYFGVFTGLAMLIALVFALTLLPQLLVLFKPFGANVEAK